jgi:hypothetical protein
MAILFGLSVDRYNAARPTTTNDERFHPCRCCNNSIAVVDCTYSAVITVTATKAEREGETKYNFFLYHPIRWWQHFITLFHHGILYQKFSSNIPTATTVQPLSLPYVWLYHRRHPYRRTTWNHLQSHESFAITTTTETNNSSSHHETI